MKKSIGLTADVSTFNTTLPQTRHLNYFMNTNPRGFAKGGDVKAGIPNYPNPNVTSGFLPMALGFDNGGEADSYISKLYKAAVKVVAGYLGKSEDDEKVKETAKKFIGTKEGKAIAEKIIQSQQGESSGAPQDTGTPITPEVITVPEVNNESVIDKPSDRQPPLDVPLQPLVPSDRQPQFNLPQPVTPKDTVTENTIPGGYYGAPPASSQTTPGIGPRLETSPGESSGAPQDTGGITEIKKEKAGMFDLNEDGVVDAKDLEFAYQNGLEWAIPALKKILDIVEDWNPDEPEKIVPDSPEKIIPKGPDVDKEKEIKESEEQEDKKEIKPELKIKPQPDGGGITGSGRGTDLGGLLETQRRKSDAFSKEDQKTLKIASDIEAGGDGGIETLKNKKDVPAWALPMMSAGFAMMASKSPYFMQALGEAGQTGLETYTAQKQAEEDKLDKEALRKLRIAQSENLKDNRGSLQLVGGKYFYKDGTPYMIDNPNGTRTHASKIYTREEIIEKLSSNMEFTMLMSKSNKTQEDINKIEEIITQTMAIFNSGEGGSSINNANKLEEDVKKKSWLDIVESWNPD